MLAHRLRRRPNIKTTLDKRHVSWTPDAAWETWTDFPFKLHPQCFNYVSPLYTERSHIGLLLTPHFYVTSVLCPCVLYSPSIMQAVKHETLTQCLRRWANISPVLGYRVVFDATLNVGQRHRRRPTLTQLLFKASCWYYSRPEVGLLTTVEWILASTGDASPTFTRHWVDVGLHCLTRSCWQATFVFCTSLGVKILKLLPNWLSLKTI